MWNTACYRLLTLDRWREQIRCRNHRDFPPVLDGVGELEKLIGETGRNSDNPRVGGLPGSAPGGGVFSRHEAGIVQPVTGLSMPVTDSREQKRNGAAPGQRIAFHSGLRNNSCADFQPHPRVRIRISTRSAIPAEGVQLRHATSREPSRRRMPQRTQRGEVKRLRFGRRAGSWDLGIGVLQASLPARPAAGPTERNRPAGASLGMGVGHLP